MSCRIYAVIIILLCFTGCEQRSGNSESEFDIANSDPAAVELADSIIVAMGGQSNWDKTRYFSWMTDSVKFFFDKKINKARIESLTDSAIFLLDLTAHEGMVNLNGKRLTDTDSLKTYLAKAKALWHLESVKKFIPFQLKKNGFTLRYLGEDTMLNGERSNLLQVLKRSDAESDQQYLLYVDLKDNLVKQLEIEIENDSVVVSPISNHKKYGTVLLPAGENEALNVPKELDERLFNEF